GGALHRRLVVEHGDFAPEVIEDIAVMRLGKKADDVGRHAVADPTDVEQVRQRFAIRRLRRLHLAAPGGKRTVVPREQPRRHVAHLRNAERIDETLERYPPALVDRGDELVGADFGPALPLGDHSRIEPEDVTRLTDQPVLPKGGDVLLAETLDVETVARHEM